MGRRFAIGTALAALALVLAACGGGTNASASSGGQPSVTITSPSAGGAVGRTFEVQMHLSFPIGAPDTGRQHVHLHFDGSSKYDIAYAATQKVTLAPGRHTIVAVVANADHSETNSKSRPVTVTVGSGANAGGTAPTPTTAPSTMNYGNGY